MLHTTFLKVYSIHILWFTGFKFRVKYIELLVHKLINIILNMSQYLSSKLLERFIFIKLLI